MVIGNVEKDHSRFRDIIKGKIKQNLKEYILHGELIGRKGKDLVSIPIPQIDIPDFRYGHEKTGGVGQGKGSPGDVLGPGRSRSGGGAGDQPGEHILEVEITLDELAQMLGDELELPRIQPRGKKNINSEHYKYTGIRQAGPESLRHFKRTYKRALLRQIASEEYSLSNPIITPIHEDKRYRSRKEIRKPENNAVILFMMDVSGSMQDEQKEIVRTEAFWIETWLRSNYDGVEIRYITHDADAREVDEESFYKTRESGGTRISSAYTLCDKLIGISFNPDDWNVYCFHFSDGDNLSAEDNNNCKEILTKSLLEKVNLFCYGEVKAAYGEGTFYKALSTISNHENLICSKINAKEDILDSIRQFLGKGK